MRHLGLLGLGPCGLTLGVTFLQGRSREDREAKLSRTGLGLGLVPGVTPIA